MGLLLVNYSPCNNRGVEVLTYSDQYNTLQEVPNLRPILYWWFDVIKASALFAFFSFALFALAFFAPIPYYSTAVLPSYISILCPLISYLWL